MGISGVLIGPRLIQITFLKWIRAAHWWKYWIHIERWCRIWLKITIIFWIFKIFRIFGKSLNLTFISGAGKFACVCCWNWLNWSIQLIWDWLKLWLIIGEFVASLDGSKGDEIAAGEDPVIWLVAGKSKTGDWLLSKFSFLMSIIGEIDPDVEISKWINFIHR